MRDVMLVLRSYVSTRMICPKRVTLDKEWIVPTHWSWITEPPLVGRAPSWVCTMKQPHNNYVAIAKGFGFGKYGDTWTLRSKIKFAEAIEAQHFNGNRWANTSLIQSTPLYSFFNTSSLIVGNFIILDIIVAVSLPNITCNTLYFTPFLMTAHIW